jgi:hypothetical protein
MFSPTRFKHDSHPDPADMRIIILLTWQNGKALSGRMLLWEVAYTLGILTYDGRWFADNIGAGGWGASFGCNDLIMKSTVSKAVSASVQHDGCADVDGGSWPESEATAAAVAAGYWGAPVAGRGAAEPSMAATPRSRRLSEQVPPRRLQELVALYDLTGLHGFQSPLMLASRITFTPFVGFVFDKVFKFGDQARKDARAQVGETGFRDLIEPNWIKIQHSVTTKLTVSGNVLTKEYGSTNLPTMCFCSSAQFSFPINRSQIYAQI